MKTGIIGKPFSGKTTVFNALASAKGHANTNVAIVKVRDERVDSLSLIYKPKKTTHANIEVVDFNLSIDGKGIDTQIGNKIKEMDALAIVVGAYKSNSPADVKSELISIVDELILLDQALIENRLERIAKESKNKTEEAVLKKCHDALLSEKLLGTLNLDEANERIISGFRFYTKKPIFALINESEEKFGQIDYPDLIHYGSERDIDIFVLSAPIEVEIAELNQDEQKAFLSDIGLSEPASTRFIKRVYEKLQLISFFTVGEDEVRAWTIRRGTNARGAAGKIHTDLEKGFIRAEVMRCEDLLQYKKETIVKEKGKFRLEGKEYIVQDGDIMHVRFNL